MRYVPEWSGWPNGPWVIRDLTTGVAYRQPRHASFWHGPHERAQSLAEALNRKDVDEIRTLSYLT